MMVSNPQFLNRLTREAVKKSLGQTVARNGKSLKPAVLWTALQSTCAKASADKSVPDFFTASSRVAIVVLLAALAADGHRVTFAFTAPTFYRDVLPLLQDHCQSCHRPGQIGPMSLETYAQVRPWARAIRERVTQRSMPPWFVHQGSSGTVFQNDPTLSDEQIRVIAEWADSGALAGSPAAAPPPKRWTEGWTIDQPDAVFTMPKVTLPAKGDIDYTYAIVHTHFTADRWIQMAEIRPENRDVVHHAVVYIREPSSSWLKGAPIGTVFTSRTLSSEEDRRDAAWTDSDLLLVYAPGSLPDRWPAGMAKFIKAGSDLVFQMHYTSRGAPTQDQTSIGLVFSKAAPLQRVLSLQLTNDHFLIPPGVPDYRASVHGTMPGNALLLSLFPHLHARGKRFTYAVTLPGEKPRTLLDVDWDFHWQMSYLLAKPLLLPAGTTLTATAEWDNSRNNPNNPDPDEAVKWGEQTWEEMMVGFFDVAVDAALDKKAFFAQRKRK
jgi:hypothetical protein